MDDIAPGLLEILRAAFQKNLSSDAEGARLLKKIQSGGATYEDAGEYAEAVGGALAKAFQDNLSSAALPDGKLYWNIADRVLRPLLEEDHALVSDAAAKVQQALNQAAGIGLKAQTVPLNADRVDGILNRVADTEQYDDVAWVLDEPVRNFSHSIVDDSVRANAEFQNRVGLRPKIIRRTSGKCCEWCQRLAGTYEYPHNVPDDVYRRHERCRCVVEYDPGSGKRQNVHTKQWTDKADSATIEARKQIGIKTLPEKLAEHPMQLASFTPASLKDQMERDGLEVKSLKKGSLKNVPFQDGGGYKVNFPDGGILQYHPETGSHHGGAYYKISTGKGGTHRYELDGTEKRD